MTHEGVSMPAAGCDRRQFLRGVALAVPAALGVGALWPAQARAAVYVPPVRARGSARLNVRDFGALGNGTADDTAAFQAAIDALPVDGGTVYVPAGSYAIDAVRSIRLRSRMHLEMAFDAKLVVIANAVERAYALLADQASDVEISGGQILGDRYRHLGTTGEWGHGIMVRGCSRVTIRDLRIADCWGDGISLGAAKVTGQEPISSADVAIANVVSTNNRRQGLTIGRARYVEVRDSEFSNSNGTLPETGIDIEPDYPGIAYKINIQNCRLRGNRRDGINVYKRAQAVTIRACTIEGNGNCGIVTVACSATYIASNTVRNNAFHGLSVQDGTRNCQVSQNTFYGNNAAAYPGTRAPFTQTGWSERVARDIALSGAIADLRITTNYYR